MNAMWAPPPPTFCEVNVDVAIRDNFCAVACVGGTPEVGYYLLCRSSLNDQEPIVGEALAVLFGIQQALQRGVCHLCWKEILRWWLLLFVALCAAHGVLKRCAY